MKETGPFSYIFNSPPRPSTAVKKLYGYLKEKRLAKVALFTAADPFGLVGSGWLTRLAPDYGITLVAEESFDPKDTNTTRQLTKINTARPQAIVVWTSRYPRGHPGQKQGAVGHYGALVPRPRPAGTGLSPPGGQGRRGGPHARRPAAGGG